MNSRYYTTLCRLQTQSLSAEGSKKSNIFRVNFSVTNDFGHLNFWTSTLRNRDRVSELLSICFWKSSLGGVSLSLSSSPIEDVPLYINNWIFTGAGAWSFQASALSTSYWLFCSSYALFLSPLSLFSTRNSIFVKSDAYFSAESSVFNKLTFSEKRPFHQNIDNQLCDSIIIPLSQAGTMKNRSCRRQGRAGWHPKAVVLKLIRLEVPLRKYQVLVFLVFFLLLKNNRAIFVLPRTQKDQGRSECF